MLQGLTTRSDDTEPALHTHVKWTVDAALQHVGFGRFQRRVLAAAILMTYTYGYLALLPVLLLPRLTSWRLSNADDAVVESAFFAGQFAGPIFGFISDRVGRRACARAGWSSRRSRSAQRTASAPISTSWWLYGH